MLCIAMGRPYQFYQFVPLATFAFVMQYIILISPPQITSRDVELNPWKYSYMFAKFFVFGFVSTLLYMSQVSTSHKTLKVQKVGLLGCVSTASHLSVISPRNVESKTDCSE